MRRFGALLTGLMCAACGATSSLPHARDARVREALSDGDVAILEGARSFELLSLDPDVERFEREEGHERDQRPGPRFHDWLVLGRMSVTAASERRELLVELVRAISEGGPAPGCIFEPRHGVRATSPDGTVDLVICNHCGEMKTYRGASVAQVEHAAESGYSTISRVTKGPMNALLGRAGIALAPDE